MLGLDLRSLSFCFQLRKKLLLRHFRSGEFFSYFHLFIFLDEQHNTVEQNRGSVWNNLFYRDVITQKAFFAVESSTGREFFTTDEGPTKLTHAKHDSLHCTLRESNSTLFLVKHNFSQKSFWPRRFDLRVKLHEGPYSHYAIFGKSLWTLSGLEFLETLVVHTLIGSRIRRLHKIRVNPSWTFPSKSIYFSQYVSTAWSSFRR